MAKKWQKIANNCKISEITKYGENMTNIDINEKKCKKMPQMGQKTGEKGSNLKIYISIVFWLETTPKMVLAVFTRCLLPEIQIFDHFWVKSAFLGPNSNRTDIFTAKPMVVGCVAHYSTYFGKKNWKIVRVVFS